MSMHLEIREGVNESDGARIVRNGELDAVAMETYWMIFILGVHLNFPFATGNEETAESAEDSKLWTTKREVQDKRCSGRIRGNTILGYLIFVQVPKESRHEEFLGMGVTWGISKNVELLE